MNGELDEHGRKARNLRKSYLEALRRLKVELGREEKLKAAAQVVVEIDAVEEGDESIPLPKDADYRLKQVRKKWDDGLEGILEERGKKIHTTARLYLKALDEEKRKLTRAGKIKDALLFEEEEARVRALPEIEVEVEVEVEAEKVSLEEVKKAVTATRWTWIPKATSEKRKLTFELRGDGVFVPSWKGTRGRWEITRDGEVVVTAADWKDPLVLVFSKERTRFEARWERKKSLVSTGERLK